MTEPRDPETATKPTLKEVIADIGRELGMRKGAYPRFIAQGRLTQAKADHQTACMEEAYRLLKQIEQERAALEVKP